MDAAMKGAEEEWYEVSGIRQPESMMADKDGNGQLEADDSDWREDANGNGSYDTDAGKTGNGGADDVVLYSASISTPRILPLQNFLPGVGPTMEYTLQTAVRNQPYDKQATAAVICA